MISNDIDDDGLRAEFRRCYHHLPTLERLNEVLKKRYSDAANELQMLVVRRLRELRTSASPLPSSADPATNWMNAFLQARGLGQPDGRPFHRYRMTDREFEAGRTLLHVLATSGKLVPGNRNACGIFAAFCAEWFRREAKSTFRKWDALAPDIFPAIHGNQKREMAEVGLLFWRRRVIEIDGAKEYLLSLALEGGVPVRVIADEGAGWLRDYLRRLLRHAIAAHELQAVRSFAHDESYRVKPSYRHDTFVDLCAELATELAKWRAVVESEALSGIDPVSFLDAKYPTWKDTIPVYLPPGEDSATRALLTGLIAEKIESFTGVGIGCERYLSLEPGGWQPALRIQATGDIPVGKLQGVSTGPRWRAIPTGALADYLPSQFALLEPPSEDQQTWRVRPLADLSRLIVGFPFSAAVSVDLSANSRFHTFDWPNGHRVSSEVLVFEEDEPTENPSLLRLVKTGSASLPSKKLYVLVPATWTVDGDDNALGRIWSIDDKSLVEVLGTLYFSEPGASADGRYRVVAGREGREETLDFNARHSAGVMANGDFDILETPLTFRILRDGVQRSIERDELFYRVPGGQWRAVLRGEIADLGMLEISWRDPKANIQIEKRKVAVVAHGASVKGKMAAQTRGQLSITDLPGWKVRLQDSAVRTVNADLTGNSFEYLATPKYRISAELVPALGHPIPIVVPVSAREAMVVDGAGKLVREGQQIDLALLRGSRAVSSHKATLVISRKGSKSQDICVEVDGELAISALKPSIEQILASSDQQDVQLDLHFVGDSKPPIRLARYRLDRPPIQGGAVTLPSVGSAVFRAVLAPELERSLVRDADGRYRLPDDAYGPCLAYLRDGPDILTRPALLFGAADLPDFPAGSLRCGLAIRSFNDLQAAISKRLEKMGTETDAVDDLKYLRSMITNLAGLPPSAMEALRHLPQHPKTLVRALLGAADTQERLSVWGLQGQLPFIWLAIPLRCWKEAFDIERTMLEEALSQVPGTDEFRMEILVKYFRDKVADLVEIEPALAVIVSAIGFPLATSAKSIESIFENFIKDERERETEDTRVLRASPLAVRLGELRMALPKELQTRFTLSEFDAVNAPILLAAAALGRATIDPDLEVLLRVALRDHGGFVSQAYPHFFSMLRTKQ
ncbi:STY4851/ECs_5259 family protein [Rhizobium sp. NZLR1b]|uniref:STY4851/ECs_5259 family protein n=1 Tax=Rhizobium sp. NZLR1b TaxID=2731099 RepID=UPI00287F78A9|nr:STY4851/ECs_5259 family protein [Rhizobium sp. NZLR1b]